VLFPSNGLAVRRPIPSVSLVCGLVVLYLHHYLTTPYRTSRHRTILNNTVLDE
jgi:hypothetical protein